MCGAAMLVPSNDANGPPAMAEVAERIWPPGAPTSGFSSCPNAVSPPEEKLVTTPLRPVDMKRTALMQRGVEALFSGSEWLTADQIGRLRDAAARNPHAAANRWRADGRIFAITKGGVLYYPRYALDEAFEPLPVVAQVLRVLSSFSPYRLAGWFESTNSVLGGRRPREILATQPAAVMGAASDQVLGAVHG